jgi:hypothetical protein
MKTQIIKFATASLLVAFLIAGNNMAFAQSAGGQEAKRESRKENIQAMKVGFITQELELTTQEAEKFWPVYNEFKAKSEEITQTRRSSGRSAMKEGMQEMTDKQAEELIAAQLKLEQDLVDLKKQYADKFKSVIGPKKTLQLYKAERTFNTKLLKMLKEDKPGGKSK